MSNNPILAIACGPIVTTWDITKTELESKRTDSNITTFDTDTSTTTTNADGYSNIFSDNGNNCTIINLAWANSISDTLSSSSSPSPSSALMEKFDSMGIRQFKPYGLGYNHDGTGAVTTSTVQDVIWNHNGQGQSQNTLQTTVWNLKF